MASIMENKHEICGYKGYTVGSVVLMYYHVEALLSDLMLYRDAL